MDSNAIVLWVLSTLVAALGVLLLAIGNRVLGSIDKMQAALEGLKEDVNTKVAAVKDELMADFIDLRDRVSRVEGQLRAFIRNKDE